MKSGNDGGCTLRGMDFGEMENQKVLRVILFRTSVDYVKAWFLE